jgi:hypothetical protein
MEQPVKTTARPGIILAIALGTLTAACVILFLGMATSVRAGSPAGGFLAPGTGDVIGVAMTTAGPYPAGATEISIQVSPPTLTADGVSTALITVTVSGGTLIMPGTLITLSLTPSTLGTIIPVTATTDGSGTALSTWRAGILAGSGELLVSDGNITRTANITLTAGAPYTLTLQAEPISQTVGLSSILTATVYDQFGNLVDPTSVSFTKDLPGDILSPVTTTNGIATSQITTTVASVAHITATTATGAAVNSTVVTFTAGTPTTITVQVMPATLIVNSHLTSLITATVVDQYDNRVPDIQLGGNTSPPGLGSVGLPVKTNTSGQAFGTWEAGILSGTGLLNVTYGSVIGKAAITLTVGEPYTMSLRPILPYLIVGNASPLLVYDIRDRFGNLVTDGTVVTFTSSLGRPSPFTDTTTSGSAGSSLYSKVAGVATITATSGSAFSTTTVTFAPDVPSSLTLQAEPVSQTVGLSSILTATVYDQFGNLVDPTSVNFTKDLPGSILSPVTTSGGVATSRVTTTVASVAHITATTGAAVSSTTVVTFTPGDAFAVTLGAYPLTQTVGLPSVLTATVKDQYGNYVADGTHVTMTNDLVAVIPSPVTTVNGIATSSVITTGVGTAHITAKSGISARDTVTVTFVADVPDHLTLQAQPVSQTVGLSSTLTATVYDRFGNRVDPTSVNFAKDLPGDIVSPVTTSGGVATSQVTITLASVAHITATTGAAVDSTVVTFTPGAPVTITVVVDPSNLTPNTGETAMITATAVDRFNNPAPGYQLTGTLVPPSLGSVSVLSPTDSYGRAFGTWTAGTITVSGQLSVTYGTRTGTYDIALSLSKPQTVSVQVVSPTLFASSGMTTSITATVVDKGNNLLPGVAVNFSLVPSTTFGSVIASATTDGNGRATSTWTATAGSLPGDGTVIASASRPDGSVVGLAPITLTVDVPYSLTLQADPTSPIAGIGSSLTATVTDRFRNLVADGTWVTFTTTQGFITWPMTTTHDGAAVSHIYYEGVGPVLITATSRTATSSPATGTLTVNFGPNVPSQVALDVNPTTQVVGNSSVVTATLRDEYSNLVGDHTLVTFTRSMGNVSPPTAFTVMGVVTSSINSTKAGVVYITVTSGLAQGTTMVTFRAGAPTTTTVDITPRALLVNSGTSAAITATLVDTYSNPVPGVTVTPTGYLSPTTLGHLSWPSPTTDPKGQAFGRWWAGTVPGSGALVVNGASVTVTLTPRTVFLPVVMRDFPPTPTGIWVRINGDAANTYQIAVTLTVSATVTADYIERMRFSNDPDLVKWGEWVPFAPTATWDLSPTNGLQTVYAQFAGHWGGISAPISDDILLFMNGDFSQPDLASWTLDTGNALSVSVATDPSSTTNPAGLLGDPAYPCNHVPPYGSGYAYGSISQYFVIPNLTAGQQLVLRFNEHIYTQDINLNNPHNNYDEFDVLFNKILVLWDMNLDQPTNPPLKYLPPWPQQVTCTVYDLGSQDKSITVTDNPLVKVNPGSKINVEFILWNRPDQNYNTYVYLDDVRLEFQGRSNNQSDEAPALPETPAEHTRR